MHRSAQESQAGLNDRITVGSGIGGGFEDEEDMSDGLNNRKSVQFQDAGSIGADEPITVEIQAQFNPALEESPAGFKKKKRWEALFQK